MESKPVLTQSDTAVVMQACLDKAREIGIDMDVAISDDGGNLLCFQRMDNARITSINIAIDKSFTAAAARKSTRAYSDISGPGQPTFGINTHLQGRFSIVPGGLPMMTPTGQFVGGIGCSSGTPDQDEIVAQAGLDAFSKLID